MNGVDGDGYILSAKQCLHRDKHLLCEPLLHLRALREKSDKAVDFTEPDDRIFRDISHFCRAVYGYKVMLAGAGQIDVFNADHFFDLHFIFNHRNFREVGIVQSAKNLVHVHFCNAMRCLL